MRRCREVKAWPRCGRMGGVVHSDRPTGGRAMAVDGAGLGPRLAGKVAFITGAGMGMGREAAVLFAEHGARVGVADLNKAAAEETVALVERAGGEAVAVTGDVALEGDVQRMIDETARRFGALHVLYNN